MVEYVPDLTGFYIFLFFSVVVIPVITFLAWTASKKQAQQYVANQQYTLAQRPKIRKNWTEQEKQQVRISQGGNCFRCGIPPERWEYHHADKDRSNNSLSNCHGLCPNCHRNATYEK